MTDEIKESPTAIELLERHLSCNHRATFEDAEDEDLDKLSTSAYDHDHEKRSPQTQMVPIDTKSHEAFPTLGGSKTNANASVQRPKWGAKNGKNGNSPANETPRASTPVSGISTPPIGNGASRVTPVTIPGRKSQFYDLEARDIIPKQQMRRPLMDIMKEVGKKYMADVTMTNTGAGKMRFAATGSGDAAQKALAYLLQVIGSKQTINVPIPYSTRALIIGKGGATIKSLQERTGARIQLPRQDEGQGSYDDDRVINVVVEGNVLATAKANEAIDNIVAERASNVQIRLRQVPVQLNQFIAGPNNSLVNELEENHGVQIRVPPHQIRSSQPPKAAEGRLVFPITLNENPIQLAGDRAAVQAARAEIERRVQELTHQLTLQQIPVQSGRQQFIIGDRGIPVDKFFGDTQCAIFLPDNDEDDMVTLIGSSHHIRHAAVKANELAMSMQLSNLDISRFHRQAAGGAASHALNVTRYLRNKREIERLERQYNVHCNTPTTSEGALPWELFFRESNSYMDAQAEIRKLVEGHPPSRMSTVAVDSFYHAHLREFVSPRVREQNRVHLVVPGDNEGEMPVLLVYEGPASPTNYELPRTQPTQVEVQEMKKGLQEAMKHIEEFVSQQEPLMFRSMEVPRQLHPRLKKFIKEEQQVAREAGQIPIKVSALGPSVKFRGPTSAVKSLVAKCEAFIEQAKADEKERDFTMTFAFPQKFANHLIGRGGNNIRELRDKFDVDIQVNDGTVELKGPPKKAEAAKAHIMSIGRHLEDEKSFTLKIEPKFHRELIGSGGKQINRLQTRYKVHILFPHTKSPKVDDSSADAPSEAGRPRREQASDEVIIRGPKKGAKEAREEILELVQYYRNNSFSATVAVQRKQLPSLIGHKGAAMDELRSSTGARIDTLDGLESADNALVEIQIKGTEEQVAAAKKILEEKKLVFEDTVVKTIEVDRKYHKTLIGVGGSNLRDMILKAGGSDDRREHVRTFQFPKQEVDSNTIRVEGRTDVVNNIMSQIQAIVAERESQVTETIDVPLDKHKSLISRGGEVKCGLECQFKVSIDIPRIGTGQTAVKIVGKSEDVAKALAYIESMTKEQQGEMVSVPRALHHAVSNNGQFFKKLRNAHHVTVDYAGHETPAKPTPPSIARVNGSSLPLITDDGADASNVVSWQVVDRTSTEEGDIPWVLRGSPENVKLAKKLVEAAIEEAKKQSVTGFLILKDPRTHRHIIGHGGNKIYSIRNQSGCKITIPRDSTVDGNAIEVIGSKEGVEKAKSLILEAVRDSANGPNGWKGRF